MLKISYELSHQLISSEKASHLYVLVKISAPMVEMKTRRPFNIGLVIDRSGSMQGDKIEYCKHASRFLVTQLAPDDIFSLVTFSDQAHVTVPAGPVTSKEQLKSAIGNIQAGGSTNLSGGWLAASAEIFKNISAEKVNRLILLTDGQANLGLTDHGQLQQIAGDLSGKGVSTTTIGFGADYAEDLMKGIASTGRGNYYFIDSPEKAPRTFAEELSELLALFAQNLTLTITPSEQVEFVGIHHDFLLVKEKGEMKVNLGDIFSGDERKLLLEFVTPASTAAGEAGISVLNLSYQQVYGEISFKEITTFIKVGYGQPREVEKQVINPIVTRELMICEAVKARNEAVKDADAGNYTKAKETIQKSIESLSSSEFAGDEIFQEEARKLKGLLVNFDSADLYRTYGRKEASYGSVVLSSMKGLLSGRRSGMIPWTAIEMLKNARSVTVITGSGMAIESGIPGVRGLTAAAGDGEINIFSPGSFAGHPEIVWDTIKKTQEMIVSMSLPESYRVLAEMEDFWMGFQLITENVDGLHSIAGNKKIIEIYGNIFRSRCIAEGKVIDTGLKTGPPDPLERKCSCGSPLRPDVLWLGEEMDVSVKTGVESALMGSSVIMIMGAPFHRFNELVRKAKEGGALVIEAHPSAPLYSDIASVCLQKSVAFVLPLIWREVKA